MEKLVTQNVLINLINAEISKRCGEKNCRSIRKCSIKNVSIQQEIDKNGRNWQGGAMNIGDSSNCLEIHQQVKQYFIAEEYNLIRPK